MKSFRVKSRQAGFVVAVAALLLALVVPTFASAADVTARSIALSSASKAATGVSYEVTFTPKSDAGAFVVNFCSNSPIIGETCTAPDGFTAAAATSSDTITKTATVVTVTKSLTANTPVTVTLANITNPSDPGPLYARIVTYDTAGNAADYDPTETDAEDANRVDSGSVAIDITDTIGVSAAVLESLTFCVSGSDITTTNCASTTAPTLELGETSGGSKALSATAVSTGDLYAQISTNAVSGAVVNLKSSAAGCGGLINSSKPGECYIGPAQQLGISAGDALFGVKAATSTDPNAGADSDGTFKIFTGSGYSSSTYALNYDGDDESTGVTSVFGDPFLDTDNLPASNKNMKLTFGVSISNSTPAGRYSTSLSLIATGKF